MENLAPYLILLLSGIILGGAAVGSLMAHTYRPTPPEYAYRRPASGALASLLVFSGFLLLLLLLGSRYLDSSGPQEGPIPPPTSMSLAPGMGQALAAARYEKNAIDGYYIQTGAYEIWDRAERAAQAIESHWPLPAAVLYFSHTEAPYKTVAGPFPTYREAAAQMEKHGLEGIILEYVHHQ
ncbi:MAG: SPOR domain-containing protein [Phaeodactylibacter sp.]|nr:SPOR domain-containing protein [Phaeodactylibacter sp.]